MSLLEHGILEIHKFPHFSPTCFDILSWNFAYDFILLYFRSCLSVVNLCQCLQEVCPFWTLESWKNTVFCTFLLHTLTYWAAILHITLVYWTSDQFEVSTICDNFCRSYAPLELRILEIQFSALSPTCFWHILLKFRIWPYFYRVASIFVENMSLLEHGILEMHSFPHFSPSRFDM